MPAVDVIEYERTWLDGLHRRDVSVADRVFAPDCIIHITGRLEPIRGIEAWKELAQSLLRGFPDIRVEIEDHFIDGDKVAMRWRGVGTHRGPFGPWPPTNKRIEVGGLIIDHLDDGKVRERWEQWDQIALMKQIGFF